MYHNNSREGERARVSTDATINHYLVRQNIAFIIKYYFKEIY
jgi:hypothetical protein